MYVSFVPHMCHVAHVCTDLCVQLDVVVAASIVIQLYACLQRFMHADYACALGGGYNDVHVCMFCHLLSSVRSFTYAHIDKHVVYLLRGLILY